LIQKSAGQTERYLKWPVALLESLHIGEEDLCGGKITFICCPVKYEAV
jgi:hypothetical protein